MATATALMKEEKVEFPNGVILMLTDSEARALRFLIGHAAGKDWPFDINCALSDAGYDYDEIADGYKHSPDDVHVVKV